MDVDVGRERPVGGGTTREHPAVQQQQRVRAPYETAFACISREPPCPVSACADLRAPRPLLVPLAPPVWPP